MAVAGEPRIVLVDTNVIIEAVRTGCWSAVTGGLSVETVETCCSEARSGNPARSGYVAVTDAHLERLSVVHRVSSREQASFALAYPGADGMDDGERDLFAHGHAREDDAWVLCSPDKASIRAAVTLGWGDRLRSLGALAAGVGAKPTLRPQFREPWLAEWRTHFLLQRGGG